MSKLLQAVDTENISEIKSYLKAYITGDPTDLDNSIKLALKNVEIRNLSIWDQHDGSEFNTNKTTWTQDYFVDLQVDLRMNFSKERFIHMLDVGKAAFPMPIEEKQNQQKVTISKPYTQKTVNNGTSRKKDRTLLYAGIAGVAVIILAVVFIKMIKNS